MGAYTELIQNYDDSRRHWLVTESDDWDMLNPALKEWGDMLPALVRTGGLNAAFSTLRVLIEVVYVCGYERGKAESHD